MARGRRGSRGPSLLIPMIVVIIAWLGLSYYAYHLAEENVAAYEKYADARRKLMETTVLHNYNRVETERLSEQVGFTGNAKVSNLRNIQLLLKQKENVQYEYFVVSDPEKDFQWVRVDQMRSGNFDGFTKSTELIYTRPQDLTDIISTQDEFINKLIDTNANIQRAIINTHKATDKAHLDEREQTWGLIKARDEKIKTNREDLNRTVGETDSKETAHTNEARDTNNFFSDLFRRPELLERMNELRELRNQELKLQREVNRNIDDVAAMVAMSEKATTTRGHYDGVVYHVDTNNRWAYINLGTKDMVTPGMTFNVIRFEHSEQPLQVAIVQIKQVLSQRTSWCEIVTTLNPNVDVRVGDRIIDSSYFREPHPQRFALVGKFGGEFSDYSRAETQRMLEEAGFTVDIEVSKFTEVVVLGADFRDDPRFKEIMDEEGGLYAGHQSFIFWRPTDVYYFLGRLR